MGRREGRRERKKVRTPHGEHEGRGEMSSHKSNAMYAVPGGADTKPFRHRAGVKLPAESCHAKVKLLCARSSAMRRNAARPSQTFQTQGSNATSSLTARACDQVLQLRLHQGMMQGRVL